MSGADTAKAERYGTPRDAALQRLRDVKQMAAQRRTLHPVRPTKTVPQFVPPKVDAVRSEQEVTSEEVEETVVVSQAPIEPEVGTGAEDNSSFVQPTGESEVLPEPKKRKEMEDALRRSIKAETELQNGADYVEQLKVKLLEEDNEKLRIALKQAQKVIVPQAASPSEALQSEVRRLTALLEAKVRGR